MPLFEYRCLSGHTRTVDVRAEAIMCGSDCSEIARRKFSFSIKHGVPEHFNNNLGTYVTNEHAVREELKRQSEVQSIATGLDHNYEYLSPADMAEVSARGVTTEGLNDEALRKVEKLV